MEKITTSGFGFCCFLVFFFLQRVLLILLLYILEFFLQESIFPFCVFLSSENSLCPPLPPSPHDWTAERMFRWIRRILRTWANNKPTGSTKRRVPPVPPDSPHTHAHRLREWKRCLTPGWTEKFFVHRIPAVRDPCAQHHAACSKGSKCCNSP